MKPTLKMSQAWGLRKDSSEKAGKDANPARKLTTGPKADPMR